MIEHLRNCRIADANEDHTTPKDSEIQPSKIVYSLNKRHYNEQMRLLKHCDKDRPRQTPNLPETCNPKSTCNWQEPIEDYPSKKNYIVPGESKKDLKILRVSLKVIFLSLAAPSQTDMDKHYVESNIDRYRRLALDSQADKKVKYCKICNLYFTTNDTLARHLADNSSHSRLLRVVLDYFDLL
jgi:hypothetical protein